MVNQLVVADPEVHGSHVAALIAVSIASRGSGSVRQWSLPTSTNADLGRPLVLRISSLSSKGTVSSARECRIVVFAFTVVAEPQVFHAGHSRTTGV